jgi:hypothetical protein
VIRGDSAVDHRNAHARSVPTGCPGDIGAHRRRRQVQKALVRPVRRYVFDVRIGFQRRKKTGGHSRVHGVDRVEDFFELAV